MEEIQLFKKFLQIEMERQEAMKELSQVLGIDVSFSKEEMIKNAEANFSKALSKKISDDFRKALRR